MLKELIISIAFLLSLSGIVAGFVVAEKSAQKLMIQTEILIRNSNETV